MSKDHAIGAVKSLNKTISEIMKYLEDEGARPGPEGGHRRFLYKKIGDLTERAFKKGFKRGHIESHKTYEESGDFPKILTYNGIRALSPKQKKRKIACKSKIKEK